MFLCINMQINAKPMQTMHLHCILQSFNLLTLQLTSLTSAAEVLPIHTTVYCVQWMRYLPCIPLYIIMSYLLLMRYSRWGTSYWHEVPTGSADEVPSEYDLPWGTSSVSEYRMTWILANIACIPRGSSKWYRSGSEVKRETVNLKRSLYVSDTRTN